MLVLSLFCLAALLGSIPELSAESCSEIKASEGNEMINGDYWIYSDGNGQRILARCESTACKFTFNVGQPCHMAENVGHLSPRGSSGISQSIIKVAYGITKLCMGRD